MKAGFFTFWAILAHSVPLLHVQFLCRALETRRAAAVARVTVSCHPHVHHGVRKLANFFLTSDLILGLYCLIWSQARILMIDDMVCTLTLTIKSIG